MDPKEEPSAQDDSARSGAGKAAVRRPESGQSLVELALMTPLLLLLLLGIIEFGRYAYIGIMVANAARAGAAYGAQSLAQAADAAGIQTAADNDFQSNGQTLGGLTVNSSFACGCDSSGTVTSQTCTGASAGVCGTGQWIVTVSVETKGTFSSIFSFPGIPGSLSIDRTCTLRVNQQ